MSSLFNHIFIPLVILLLFSEKLKIDSRKTLALSFFAVLPDADTIFSPHRAAFHNMFMLIIPLLLLILIKSRRDILGIICFYLTSHLVLDLFNGGIFLLYPLYNNVYFIHAELLYSENSFTPMLDYGISNKIMNMGRGEPVISSENIGITIVLIISTLILIMQNLKKKTI